MSGNENFFEETMTEARDDRDLKIQNLTAIAVLLGGLLVGSLFVDVAQLLTREGYSPRAVRESNILEAAGKTWVAYSEPKVAVKVLTDQSCAACSPDEALVWFRRILPTMEAVPVEASSEEGKRLAETYGVKTLPAFIFSDAVAATDFFAAASEIFTEKDGSYVLDTSKLGLAPGKYLTTPSVGDDTIVFGSHDAKLRVVMYSDFQCPYSKAFYPTVKRMLSEYGDRVAFVFKQLPLPFHAQAENAALAGECANEQGKYQAYSDLLFARQAEWGAAKGTQRFKDYARQLGLKYADFAGCLDSKKFSDKVAADVAEASSFGVDGTPGTFVGDEFVAGAIPYEDLKKAVDAKLSE
ncbi:MAG: DsbA family protein [Candidatus Moranbacteria bacterium]|nr:DsbA family protein [Candidatus Moranbacteria bacterium]NTW45702.1 DsbA family protein [Candidatus Moranbacteria bacterium]